MQLSYWEKKSFFNHVDVVIIGSGIVGLHAAIYLKEMNPLVHVLILEKGFLPYGASTRNAGFACFGSLGELLNDLKTMSEEEVFNLVERRFKGLQKLRNHLGDQHLGYEELGGYEVFAQDEKAIFETCYDKLDWINGKLANITHVKNTFSVEADVAGKNGFKGISYCIKNSCEGQLDTGKMMNSLMEKARSAGVVILNGLGVKQLNDNGSAVEIETDQGFSFHSPKVLVTTNGFARQLLPNLDVVPARAQVIVTSEIQGLKLNGAFHYNEGYYYFRNVGNRVLFGGGRNLDFKMEETEKFGLTTLVQQKLESMLSSIIIPGISFEIEHRWSGIMGLGSSKSTLVKMVSPHIGCSVRMGGMGVAIGSIVGEEGARMILEK